MKFKNRLVSKPPRRKQLGLIVLGLTMILGTYFLIQRSDGRLTTEKSVRKYYSQKLGQLDLAVNNLSTDLVVTNNVPEDLDRYEDRLSGILNACSYITDKYQATSRLQISQDLKDRLSQSKQLCSDLRDVVTYSQSVYRGLRPYMLTESSDWPVAGSQEFRQHLDQLEQIAINSMNNLQKLHNSPVQDPALPELSVQLDLSIKVINQIKTESDAAKIAALSSELQTQVTQDKQDFLLARNYYWNNTIGVKSLQRSIKNLHASFEPNKKS